MGYLHNSILKANGIQDLVFTSNQYAQKIFNQDNHLYFSLLNDIEKHGRNLLIIGCGFAEQSVFAYLHSRINRTDLKIIHINLRDRPNYGIDFEEKVKDITWVNCSAEAFLELLSKNKEKVSKQDLLPTFLQPLTLRENSKSPKDVLPQSFSDFLSSKHLKYFSRGSFKYGLNDEIQNQFLSENDFLKYILNDNYYGLVIHGQGGIGKTRLMLELGKRLLFKNFIVIKVLVDFRNFEELVEYIKFSPNRNYLLLFDYIEEQKVFDETVKWITSTNTFNVKVIANCRNTFISEIQNNFSEYFKFIDIGFKNKIGLEKKHEQEYKKEVILSIINSISDKALSARLKEDDVLKSFYQARPSFAAFVKYIHLKNPNADLSIATNETFSNWLIKKLKSTTASKVSYSEFFEKKIHVFQILSCLPSNAISTRSLEKQVQGELQIVNEITKLIHDGWIDETEKYLTVVHDTVNDTLLLEFFRHFQFRGFYLTNFLEFAVATGSISSMMWSIQRVWDQFPHEYTSSLQQVIGGFVDNSLEPEIAKENWFKYKLDNTKLISEIDRINIIIRHKHLLTETIELEKFGSSLAYSMQWVFENISDNVRREFYAKELNELFFDHWNLNGKFDDFVKDARGGKIISPYINLFGIDNYISNRFNAFLGFVKCNSKNLESISLAIVSWLNGKGEIKQGLKDAILLWFEIYENDQPENVNPNFLIHSCLSRSLDGLVTNKVIQPTINTLKVAGNSLLISLGIKGNISAEIKTNIIEWFTIYEKEKPININPTALALAWLENGDDGSIVRDIVLNTLEDPYRSIEIKAKSIGLWLDKLDEPKLVEPFIEEILSAEIFPKAAYYIIGHWLENSNNPLIIKPYLSFWLSNPLDAKICSFIFQNWLKNGDDPSLIVEPVKRWILMTDSVAISVGNVLSEYIQANGNISDLLQEIIKWLNDNSDSSHSVSILGFLLQKVKEDKHLNELEDSAAVILKKYATLKEIGFVIGFWISKGGRISIVEPYLVNWLRLYGDSKQACYIISSWLERKGDFKKVKEFVITSYKGVQDNFSDSSLLFNWLQHGDDPYLIADLVESYFKVEENREKNESRYLITNWLEQTNLPELVRGAIEPWLTANSSDPASIYVSSFWLRYGDDIELVRSYLVNNFSSFLKEKDSHQVLENWMKFGGSLDIIEGLVKNWIKSYNSESTCLHIVYKWMNYGGDYDIIQDFIKNDLSNFSAEKTDFPAIINLWLKTGGNPAVIKNVVVKYLETYGEQINASYVLSSWIEYGGDFEIINRSLEKWLDMHLLDQFNASFVLATALEHKKGFAFVREKALVWLNRYGKSEIAKYPLSSWLKHQGKAGSSELEPWIIHWTENFYNHKKQNWRDDLLLNFLRE